MFAYILMSIMFVMILGLALICRSLIRQVAEVRRAAAKNADLLSGQALISVDTNDYIRRLLDEINERGENQARFNEAIYELASNA